MQAAIVRHRPQQGCTRQTHGQVGVHATQAGVVVTMLPQIYLCVPHALRPDALRVGIRGGSRARTRLGGCSPMATTAAK